MYARTTKLTNPAGLHARPAALFVNETKNYKSSITIRRAEPDANPLNAKSIVLILSMALKENTEVEIAADGEDEIQAVDNIIALIESGFEE